MSSSILLLVCLFLASGPANAMTFDTTVWRWGQAVRGSGPIQAGDARRLASALGQIEPRAYGAKVLLLDSPGGSIDAAMEISALLDRHTVHTVVPSGVACDSACASVIFIAGSYRTVEPGGSLGQHSCSRGGVQDPDCNEELAQHALAHGVSHGSVAAFVTYVPPTDIMRFSRQDADCWGLSKYPFSDESEYFPIEPCVGQMIADRFPDPGIAWRIDFLRDGYRAFVRPVADHLRELEIGMYCDEARPGRLFLTMDIGGPSEVIEDAILSARLDAAPATLANPTISVSQVDDVYSRAEIAIPTDLVAPFLTKSDLMQLRFRLRPPYQDIVATTQLHSSRQALLFAANHCISR